LRRPGPNVSFQRTAAFQSLLLLKPRPADESAQRKGSRLSNRNWSADLLKAIFSTTDLPPELDDRTRFVSWGDVMTEKFGRRHAVPTDARPFFARSEFAQFGAVGLARHTATLASTSRTSADVAHDGADYFAFGVNRGAARVACAQRGYETIVDPGCWTLVSLSEAINIRYAEAAGGRESRWLTAVVPCRQLLDVVATAEDLVGTSIDPDRPSMRYLQRYLGIVLGPGGIEQADPALLTHVGNTLVDLIALALGAGRDAAERVRGLRGVRLQEILAEIKAGFADPALSPGRVALKLGVSARYLQNLLQQSGTSFTERVLELRLQKARNMLIDRRNQGSRVSEIAWASGFSEVSHFNRCFRRRFGTSPTSYRAARGDADIVAEPGSGGSVVTHIGTFSVQKAQTKLPLTAWSCALLASSPE
jgi:AraC-like DNA-binding protein